MDTAQLAIHRPAIETIPVQIALFALGLLGVSASQWTAQIQTWIVAMLVIIPAGAGVVGVYFRLRSELRIAVKNYEIKEAQAEIAKRHAIEAVDKESLQGTIEGLQASLEKTNENYERLRQSNHHTNNRLGQMSMENHELLDKVRESLDARAEAIERLERSERERGEMRDEMERLRKTMRETPGRVSGEVHAAMTEAAGEIKQAVVEGTAKAIDNARTASGEMKTI